MPIDYQFSENLHRFAARQWADVGRGPLWVTFGRPQSAHQRVAVL